MRKLFIKVCGMLALGVYASVAAIAADRKVPNTLARGAAHGKAVAPLGVLI